MPNWVVHTIELPGDEIDFNAVLAVCRNRTADEWSEDYDACELMPDGRIRVTHQSRYSPMCDIAYEVSLAVPDAQVDLSFWEPMLVIEGNVSFRAGHVIRFWERSDESIAEWSAESSTLREHRLEYQDEGNPFGEYKQHLVGEWQRTEDEIFGQDTRAELSSPAGGLDATWTPLFLPSLEDLASGIQLLSQPVLPSDVALGVMVQEFDHLAAQLGWDPRAYLGGCFPVPIEACSCEVVRCRTATLELGREDEWLLQTAGDGACETHSTVSQGSSALGVSEATLLRRIRGALIRELEEYGATFGFNGYGASDVDALEGADA